jgi:hypothetical protein
LARCLPDSQEKYDPRPPARLAVTVLGLHILLMGFTVWFLLTVTVPDFGLALAHFIPLGGGLWLNSRVLELKPGAVWHAALFWLSCAVLPWAVDGWLLPVQASSIVLLLPALVLPLVSGRRLLSQTV